MNVDIRPFSLDLAEPLETATGTIDSRDGFLFRIERDGDVGVGEATPLPGWTESRDRCRSILNFAAGSLENAAGPGDSAMFDGSPAANHAIATAIADFHASRADLSVSEFLAEDGVVSESVPVNATVGDGTVEQTAERARAALDAGFDCVKVKVGARAVEEDIERLRAVRDLSPGVAIRADANGSWTPEAARRAHDAVRLEYVEQPLPADDLDGHAALREDVPVALDESLAESSVPEAVKAEAADYLVVKPMVIGGPHRVMPASEWASKADMTCVVTTTVDGVVARTAALHAAAAIPDAAACGLATADRLADDLGPDPAPVEDGEMRVPTGPGLGTEVWN